MKVDIFNNTEPTPEYGANGSHIERQGISKRIAGLIAYQVDSWALRDDQSVLCVWKNCSGGTINTSDDNHLGVDQVVYIGARYGGAGTETLNRITNGNRYDDSGDLIEVPFIFARHDGPDWAATTAYTAGDVVRCPTSGHYVMAAQTGNSNSTEPTITSAGSQLQGIRWTWLSASQDQNTIRAYMIGADNETFQYTGDLLFRINR